MPVEQCSDQFDKAALIGDRRIAARKLFHDDRIGEAIEPHAAILLWNGDAKEAQCRHLAVKIVGKGLIVVEDFRARTNRLMCKATGGFSNSAVGVLIVSGQQNHSFPPAHFVSRYHGDTLPSLGNMLDSAAFCNYLVI